ncbi:MAG: L-serine ammonia-lyase, iron-sulfur-dependent, subunit alpha [Clostridiaceae bacterium]|nr:L-serine ammonia-lyase, iron-sulfur-dependent, subunit alpha [Clostridiaceae bacterium]
MSFTSGSELLSMCSKSNVKIFEIMLAREVYLSQKSKDSIISEMQENLSVMKRAIERGLTEDIRSVSGLTGGDAKKLRYYHEKGQTVAGQELNKAVAAAMAVLEVNGAMGQIVAAPTAGSSGILPGAIITTAERFGKTDEDVINALFTASAVGYLITNNATVAGAEGGCQAETGAAAAMAASAIVEMLGGTPAQALDAAAISIKNILGLVCDPIAGLVEAPCIKRNAIGTTNALISADLALAGITSIIPFDEVVEAMLKVGKSLPCELRETGTGGLAETPTGRQIRERIFGDI